MTDTPEPSKEMLLRTEGEQCEVCQVSFLPEELHEHRLQNGMIERICADCLQETLEYETHIGI